MIHQSLRKGEVIALYHEKLGFFKGTTEEEFVDRPGTTAFLRVSLREDARLPGIREMTININFWDVYAMNDPQISMILLTELLLIHNP